MRIRSIKPDFWRSDDIARLSWDDRLLFIGLWSYVDDNGVGRDEERLIVADLFALDTSFSESSLKVHDGLMRLQTANLITRYTVDGRPFLHVTTWDKHQRINRPSPGRYPLPTCANAVFSEPSLSPQSILSAGAGEQGNRGTGETHTFDPADAESNDDESPTTPSPRMTYPQAFEAFWDTYPRHTGKRKALDKWRAAVKRADTSTILDGARRYADDPNRVDQFTQQAERWLAADGWLDDPLPDRNTTGRPSSAATAAAWLSAYDDPAPLLEGAAS